VKAGAAAAPEGDESDALVAEWLAKEQQDKLATTEQPAAEKEAEKEEKGKEKEESETKEAKEAEAQADEKDKDAAAAAEEKPARKRGATATGRKGQTARTGGKAARRQERRRARRKQAARKPGAKGGNESDDDDGEDFYDDDPELRQFRQTDAWRAYMREAMARTTTHHPPSLSSFGPKLSIGVTWCVRWACAGGS
jgi:hypothetical protein